MCIGLLHVIVFCMCFFSVCLFICSLCTLLPYLVNKDVYIKARKDGTDGQTDGRQTVTLRFPLDAASVTTAQCVWQDVIVAFETIHAYSCTVIKVVIKSSKMLN